MLNEPLNKLIKFCKRAAVTADRYSRLLEPLSVGRLALKNRLTISAHSYNLTDMSGVPDVRLVEYVRARMTGGAAMVVLGETYIADPGLTREDIWGGQIASTKLARAYSEIRVAADLESAVVIDQLSHPGGQVWALPGATAAGPSSIPHPSAGMMPRALTEEEVENLVACYASSAKICVDAGAHGVELKADQGKLIHQFLSARYNKREDLWGGGTVEERSRFLLECVSAVRSAIGPDRLLGVRLPVGTFEEEDLGGDLSADECLRIAELLDHLGSVDYLSLNGATNSTPLGYVRSHGDPTVSRNTFAAHGKVFRERVRLPIIVASRIVTPDDAVRVIESGGADAVAMTRAFIADPEIGQKLRDGRREAIRPCISCNQSCVGNTWEGREVRCVHNPFAGVEHRLPVRVKPTKAAASGQLLVVGAGPAGLAAAAEASELGLQVLLIDRANEVGGRVVHFSRVESRSHFHEIVRFQERAVRDSANVRTELATDFADVWASVGSRIAGIVWAGGGECVLVPSASTPPLGCMPAAHLLSRPLDEWPSRSRVVIVDEDWIQCALSIAAEMTSRGCTVTLVTTQEYVGKGLDFVTLSRLGGASAASHDRHFPFHSLHAVDSRGCVLRDVRSTRTTMIEADQVITCYNLVPAPPTRLAGCELPVELVGDALFPRGIEFAIRDGVVAARKIAGYFKKGMKL